MGSRVLWAAPLAAFAVVLGCGQAAAKCTRLAFSVNDYGKEGPTRDAKELLDKHIAKWTAERGIKNYTVGKKDVSCELFLDFIVFDEHTCKAEATVCWSDGAAPNENTDGRAPAAGAPKPPSPPAPAASKSKAAEATAH